MKMKDIRFTTDDVSGIFYTIHQELLVADRKRGSEEPNISIRDLIARLQLLESREASLDYVLDVTHAGNTCLWG